MFEINEDKTINITRGDIGAFTVDALNEAGEKYLFQKGDVVRIKVTEKKACENVMFQKDFVVEEETEQVEILLTEQDTKIGEVISKPTDYWYEVELNPFTNPQTIIGYDEDGAKIFKLFPEGNDIEPVEPTPEDIPVVDEELDLTSERPVQNHVIARAILTMQEEIARIDTDVNITSEDLEPLQGAIEANKTNIAKNTGNIEDLTNNVEELNAHTANTSNPHNVTAEQTHFDKNISGMSANNVQGAIDELKGTIGYSKKQLIPYPYDALVTENGMVFTDLGDGRIEVNGSNPNGTSSYYLHYANSKYKPNFNNSKVTLSLKSVSGQASVFFRLWGEGGTYIKEYDFAIDRKNGSLTIDMPNETDYSYATIELFYYQGSTVTNDIVEIMIRYASIEDDTYEPYVEDVKTKLKYYDYLDIKDKISKSTNCHSIDYAYVKNGNVYIGGFISASAVASSSTWLFVINDATYKPMNKVLGRFSYSTSGDNNKVLNVNIENNTGYVVLLNTLSNVVAFEFSYPIK